MNYVGPAYDAAVLAGFTVADLLYQTWQQC
jgi:hypothetical protein